MVDLNKLLAEQEARRLAGAALVKAAGASTSSVVSRPVCLVTSFAKRSDVPVGTLLVKMSSHVVDALLAMGLYEPVSLSLLPGQWWVANVDASVDNASFEAGGCTTVVITTTEVLSQRYSSAYCEVTRGPFGSRDEIDGYYFATETFDRGRLGENAQVLLIPAWSAKQLTDRGMSEPFPLTALLDKWWVCGMGGGVVSTEQLAVGPGPRHHISDGPFDSKDDADYAFDVLWEAPE
jgi:hypothetical protein